MEVYIIITYAIAIVFSIFNLAKIEANQLWYATIFAPIAVPLFLFLSIIKNYWDS